MIINNIFVSYSDGFPVCYTAANTKISFLGKGLVANGNKVLLINKFYGLNNIAPEKGVYEGLSYMSFSSKGNKIKSAIFNTVKLFRVLKEEYKEEYKNIVYIGCGSFVHLSLIALFSRLIGYKVAFIFEEYQAAMDLPLLYRINGILHSLFLGYFANFILPISEFLRQKSLKFRKPIFKLPICADFYNPSFLANEDNNSREKYFVYCASVVYQRAFDFVVDSFELILHQKTGVKLHIILSGERGLIEEKVKYIHSRGLQNDILIKTKLPYDELCAEYTHAIGLLIPLFEDSIVDKARFSQKISEYLTTKRPVISTNVGDIGFYFQNKKNMLIAKKSSVEEYSSLLVYAIENLEEVNIIGEEGFVIGAKNFDFRILAQSLSKFILEN